MLEVNTSLAVGSFAAQSMGLPVSDTYFLGLDKDSIAVAMSHFPSANVLGQLHEFNNTMASALADKHPSHIFLILAAATTRTLTTTQAVIDSMRLAAPNRVHSLVEAVKMTIESEKTCKGVLKTEGYEIHEEPPARRHSFRQSPV